MELPQAMQFVKFTLAAPSYGPEFNIKYSDDESSWATAATVQNGGSSVEWVGAGAHKYWRYELTGGPIKKRIGHPYYNGLEFYTTACTISV